ncbi:MAG: DUF2117 domain-containing protein [Methanolinea sp.]|nr:DUF2117 domain-containing protein [Methanolinea sp.]
MRRDPGIVLVIHGPEIFDSGAVKEIVRLLEPSRLVVAGVMARTAAEESGLPCEYPGLPPSIVIKGIHGPVVLANQGKTADSGRIFGEIVAARLGREGLIHLELSGRFVFCWGRPVDDLALEIAARTGCRAVHMDVPGPPRDTRTRVIRGCIAGEPVYVNGIVIGTAAGEEVVLRSEGGDVIPESGLITKSHGLEKLRGLGRVDVSLAWCKSGPVRSKPPAISKNTCSVGRVAFVDHCGHRLYEEIRHADICGIVSVGDDTTYVCGHIGAHLGIPVFGIVDGDRDHVVSAGFAPGSRLALADPGADDHLGREIALLIPEGIVEWEELVRQLTLRLGDRARVSRCARE